MLNSTGYSFREGFKALKNNIAITVGSIITIFLSLFLIGLFVLGNGIMGNVATAIEEQVSITAYLSDEYAQEQVDEVTAYIKSLEGVENISFTSKEQALENFRSTMTSSPEIVDQLESNPLPASLEIELSNPQLVNDVANSIQENETFAAICDSPERSSDSIKYGQRTVERLFGITNMIRNVGTVLVVLLVFVAFVFMNNTIRLAVMNRRKEISIQKLVGASNGFIRGPFLAEGIIHALIGSLFAIAGLEIIHRSILPKISSALAWLPLELAPETYLWMYGVIVLAGILIGTIGSSLAMRKYLKI